MTASDIVLALVRALRREGEQSAESTPPASLPREPSAYVTALLVPTHGAIEVDRDALAALGVTQVGHLHTSGRVCPGSAHVVIHGHVRREERACSPASLIRAPV